METEEAQESGDGLAFRLWPVVVVDVVAVLSIVLADLEVLPRAAFYVTVSMAGVATLVETVRWLGRTGLRRRPSDAVALLRRPPGRVFHLLLVVPLFGVLWAASSPGGSFSLGVLSFLMLAVAVAVWIGRGLAFLSVRRRGSLGDWRWLLVGPVVGLAVVGLLAVEAPLRVRWALSRPDFDDSRALGSDAGIVGLYSTRASRRIENGVLFPVPNAGFLDEHGFAYLPFGPPGTDDDLLAPDFDHLGGDWYTYRVPFD